MKNIIAFYFSGTGNTKYVAGKIKDEFEKQSKKVEVFNIENITDISSVVIPFDTVILAYPIYASQIPGIMKDFIIKNKQNFKNKNLIVIVTQSLFSGDGSGLCYRLLKDENINLLAGIHINCPSNINVPLFFPIKNDAELNPRIKKIDKKVCSGVKKIAAGKKIKNGLKFYSRPLAFFIQRAYTKNFGKKMAKKLSIDDSKCISCGICAANCPTKNLILMDKKIEKGDKCTVCYRCINICPKMAISMSGKTRVQYRGIKSK